VRRDCVVNTSEPPENSIEQPSGKNAAYENFPVGSWLLPARLRPHIMTYYEFARTIDDIADSNTLDGAEKIRRLDGYARQLGDSVSEAGYDKAAAMRDSLSITGITTAHCFDLITAFKQDAVQQRYETWDELLGYCRLSAAPVGRYLIDLHGGTRDQYVASDALCAALQIINHLQDMGDDYRLLDRVYMPMSWFRDARITEQDLSLSTSSCGVRQVIDRALDGVDILLTAASGVSTQIVSRRLSMEAVVILMIARALRRKLATRDPLAGRVVLGKLELALCGVRGILSAIV
jgi:hydroxysqualene synthase